MKVIAVSFLVIAGFGVHLVAQQTAEELPTYTTEQRWERAGRMTTVTSVSGLAYAKSIGQSAREYGKFCADLMKAAWGEPGSGSVNIIRGVRMNFLLWPGAEFEITASSDVSVTGRVNRPWIKHFGENKSLYGVSLDEFEEVYRVFNHELAEYLGLKYEDEIEGKWFTMTYSHKE